MNIFVSPHNDDETLFGAFTLLREHPLVLIVTDSFIQQNRGENITNDQRWQETIEAMKILKCPVVRLGIRDDCLDEWVVKNELKKFEGFNTIYAPAIQGGHVHHDTIGKVCKEMFGDRCEQYTTYTKTELYTTGKREIVPTQEEHLLKYKALQCYQSQLNLGATAPHFKAVFRRSEWFM